MCQAWFQARDTAAAAAGRLLSSEGHVSGLWPALDIRVPAGTEARHEHLSG